MISYLLLCFSEVFKIRSKNERGKIISPQRSNSALPEQLCLQFSLAEIKAATNNFHEDMIVAEGGFGLVYRGFIGDGASPVAIKRWTPWIGGTKEFRREVQILCQLHHPNIVSLIGFSEEKGEMIRVYEYVNNGTLSDHLHGRNCMPLSWKQRLEICVGIARGLHYLHTGAKCRVTHRDVNSRNILLDELWTPKLCNFGYSKAHPHSMSRELSSIKTGSDIAHEDVRDKQMLDRADVFSFGLLLFEVLGCRGLFDATLGEDQQSLGGWASKCIEDGEIYHIIDPYLKGQIAPECFKKFVEIVYDCVSFEVNKRPAMGEVEVTLELAFELQKKADAEIESINPGGGCIYKKSSSGINPLINVVLDNDGKY